MNFQTKPEPWTEFANCREVLDPDIFFPETELPHAHAMHQAFRICETCTVKVQCLDYGKQIHAIGVWGGTYLNGYERNTTA